MLCRNPFIKVRDGLSWKVKRLKPDIEKTDGLPFGCGQCLACRINKRRLWTLRLLLEYTKHDKASFVTLTYSPENLPTCYDHSGSPQDILYKRDVQLFLKRLRKYFNDRKIRFYCAGEYGPNGTHRPHYHLILFGVDALELDEDFFFWAGKSGPIKPDFCRKSLLYELWNLGIVHVGEVTQDSIAYVAGYVTSKLTRKGDGRTPEFALMSRRPGLGFEAILDIAHYLQTLSPDCLSSSDIRQIHVNGHMWPIGRHILSKLRIISDIRDGLEEYIASYETMYRESQLKGVDFLSYIVEQDNQRFLNLEKRQNLFKKRNKI